MSIRAPSRDIGYLSEDEFRILRTIVELERPNRSDVLKQSCWGSSKTDSIIQKLCRDDFITIEQIQTGSKGRNPHVYSAKPEIGYFIGGELNICHDRITISDFNGVPILSKEYAPSLAAPDRLKALENSIRDLIDCSLRSVGDIKGIGLGLHKQIGERMGDVKHILHDGNVIDLNFKQYLEETLEIPVYVGSKRIFVFLKDYRNRLSHELILNAHIEYGITLGIFKDADFFKGTTGMSGQIGHLIVPHNSRRCYCGNTGCLRTLVSFQAICTKAQEDLERGITSSIDPAMLQGPDFQVGAEHIIEMALGNDKLAINLVHDVGGCLGSALASVITILNPSAIIIHSNFVRAGDIFTAPVKVNIQRNTLDASIGKLEIEFTALRPYTVSEGGALYAQRRFLEACHSKIR